jgi:hypothetical protein
VPLLPLAIRESEIIKALERVGGLTDFSKTSKGEMHHIWPEKIAAIFGR